MHNENEEFRRWCSESGSWNFIVASEKKNDIPLASNMNQSTVTRMSAVKCVYLSTREFQWGITDSHRIRCNGQNSMAMIPCRDNGCTLPSLTLIVIQTNVEWKQKPGLLSLDMGDNDLEINTCKISLLLLRKHAGAAQSRTTLLQSIDFPFPDMCGLTRSQLFKLLFQSGRRL